MSSKKLFRSLLITLMPLLGIVLLWGWIAGQTAVHAQPIIPRPQTGGTVVYVNHAATGANNGTSWDDAHTDLQVALTTAISGTEIWVAQGVYTPGTQITNSFVLTSGVQLYGGFAATETQRTERDWDTNITVLSGDIDGNDSTDPNGIVTDTANITGTNSYHVVVGEFVSATAVLDGFTITAGYASGPPTSCVNPNAPGPQPHCGGGIAMRNSSPIMTNLTIIGNKSTYSGGGMFIKNDSNPVMTNITFQNNTSGSSGGGLSAWYSSDLVVTDTTFTGNQSGNSGGGMDIFQSALAMTDSYFTANRTIGSDGGAMYMNSTIGTISATTFYRNSTTGGGTNGGAIYMTFAVDVHFSNVLFQENTAVGSGGGVSTANNSSPVFMNVIFAGNVATDGGGARPLGGAPQFINTLFVGNHAHDDGGGIQTFSSGGATLTNVTFAYNHANDDGGGIYLQNAGPQARNIILWGNTAGGSFPQAGEGGSGEPTLTDVLVQGGCGSLSNIHCTGVQLSANPLFVSTPSAGDGDWTTWADNDYGDLRLQVFSPAMEVGDNSHDPNPDASPPDTLLDILTDLGGLARVIDGDGNGIAQVDLGAYERPSECYVETTGDTTTDYSSADASAVQTAVTAASPNDLIKVSGICAGVSLTSGLTQTVYISKSLTIRGGYNSSDWTLNAPQVRTTTLDALSLGRVVVIPAGVDATLENLIIRGGVASDGSLNDDGGGIWSDGNLTINHSIIADNVADDNGGGINQASGGELHTSHTIIQHNNTNGSSFGTGFGGGVNSGGSATSFSFTTFYSNTAGKGGGGLIAYNTVTVTHSLFRDNQAADNVGGGLINHGDMMLINSTVSGNHARYEGGGIAFLQGTLAISRSTIVSNSNELGQGGGIYYATGFPSVPPPTIANSMVAFNTGFSGNNCHAALAGLGYNLENANDCGFSGTGSLPNTDPLLTGLADNGGESLTHALLAGSPAVDAGDLAYASLPGDTDQRGLGFPRVYNGRLDIGAHEQAAVSCFIESNGDNVTDYSSVYAVALQTAVDEASSGDLLKVAGTCAGVNVTTGISQTVYISKSLTLQGGYDPSNWLAASDSDSYPTTLNAQNLGRGVVVSETAVAQIDNLIITGGQAPEGGGIFVGATASLALNSSQVLSNTTTFTGIGTFYSGGGLGNLGQTVISNTIFSNNHSVEFAGGMGNGPAGRLTIDNSTFLYNSADAAAGALGNVGWVTVTNSIFISNTSNGSGGIGNLQVLDGVGWMLVQSSTFLTNTAVNNGGAIDNDGGELHLIDSTFIGNSGKSGGAIYNNSGNSPFDPTLFITHSTFLSNTATNGDGGVLRNRRGTATINGSTFSDNTASGSGGAILLQNGSVNISNSTIAHNSAATGGGINNETNGTLTLFNSTVSTNTASLAGGILNNGALTLTHITLAANSGQGLAQNANGDTWMRNSIIAGNAGTDCEIGNSFTDLGYNLVEDGSCISAGTSTSGDPMLGLLADNGGNTWTHGLLAGSSAIDHIPNGVNGCGTTYTADQRGYPRPSLNLNCDMGALEYPPCSSWPMSAANEDALNLAIFCFNQIDEAGTFTLTVTANMTLTASTLAANNSVAGVALHVEGNNYALDGQGISGIRPLAVTQATTLTVNDLTITGGNVTGTGGGILIGSVPVTLTNVTLLDNIATGNGGGLFTNGGLTLINSQVINNMGNSGGGVYANGGLVSLTSITFAGNHANANGGGLEIANGTSSATISNSSFISNTASNDGGAAIVRKNLTIDNSTFANNVAGATKDGGALKITGGTTTILQSAFYGNSAGEGGGIYVNDPGKMKMTNSTLSSNIATTAGGGVYFKDDTELSEINYSTLYGNSAATGGGIAFSNYNFGDLLFLRSSIIAGSIGGDCVDPANDFTDRGYNLVADGSCISAGTSVSGEPMVAMLADNGGDTLTHLLLPFSPALDYIPANANGCGTGYTTDQRDMTRPFDNFCDIGAVELAINYVPVAADDVYTTTEEITLTVPISGVLANDVDGDWDGLTAVLSSTTPSGNLSLNSDGSFSYSPDANFCGADSFTYSADDGEDLSLVATVTVNVTCVNDAPVAVDDSYVGVEDVVLSVPAEGILSNDIDVDGDVLTATLLTDVVTGTLALSGDGAFVYTPTLNWFGVVTFTYQADDELAASNTAVVTLTILSENDPPVVNAGSNQSVNEGEPVQFNGTFVDPGRQFAQGGTSIHWDFGDGNSATGTLTPTHSYGDDGLYTATLTVTDTEGAAVSDALLVTVTNVDPGLSALPNQSAVVGTVVSFTAVFTDPGTLDTHTATIDWGDGSSEAGTIDQATMTASGSHAYVGDGVYTVTITLTDDDSGTTAQTFTVTIVTDKPLNSFIYLPFVTKT